MNPNAMARHRNMTRKKKRVFAVLTEKYGEECAECARKESTATIRTQAATQPRMNAPAVKRYPNLHPLGGVCRNGRAESTNMGISSNELTIIRMYKGWVKNRYVCKSIAAMT